MKKNLLLLLLALGATACPAWADNRVKAVDQWNVADASLRRSADKQTLDVACQLDMNTFRVPSQEAVLFTPMLVNGTDTMRLSSVGVYGRSRYYYYLRHSFDMISGRDEVVIRNNQRPATYQVSQAVSYQPWMNGARLMVEAVSYGCCFTELDRRRKGTDAMFMLPPGLPRPAYVYAPADTMVVDSLEGAAMIQFIVDRTEIRPDWRDNYRELGKITHSIDTIKADPDLTITEIWLKGFASPESPYAHNTDLARGRTQSLKEYIRQLYNFDAGIIQTDYEPEDWAGLRRYIEQSNMDNREALLRYIDTPWSAIEAEDPAAKRRYPASWHDLDKKEFELKRRYPQDYKFLLEYAYPPLRHTEYKVKYKVRRFYDVEEVKRILEVNPRKLTLNDFHLVAGTYERGSEDFNYVYALAARLHPESTEANLNAANAALERGNAQQAEQYLQKAGQSAEAQYARALLLFMREQYADALPGIQAAAKQGIEGAADFAQQLEAYLNYASK